MPSMAAYGTWSSPITPESLTEAQVGLGGVSVDHEDIYWLESRPEEAGRTVVVRRRSDGRAEDDLTPSPFNVRTRVHEYGGGAFAAMDGILLAANFADQRLYRLEPGRAPLALTPESQKTLRYADFAIDARRGIAFAVREDHRGNGEAVNSIVRIDLDGRENEGTIVAEGHDFFAAPRLSPDGRQLAFLSWDHPNMPWDATTLWLGDLDDEGALGDVRKVAGGEGVSVMQPCFSPEGRLHYVSDESGWWTLFRLGPDGAQPLCPMAAEFAVPAWGFGQSTYGFLGEDRLLAAYLQNGRWHLATLDTASGQLDDIDLPYTSVSSLGIANGQAVMRVGAPDRPAAIIALDPASGRHRVLKTSGALTISPDLISVPEAIAFPTEGGNTAHAFYYPPKNPDYASPQGAPPPPLIVKSHGGPTGNTSDQFNLATQFWTSRGFAVVDVDYGGSTGYGRAYRERLNGRWGEVDVLDCVNAAKYLAEAGKADPKRIAITGGSAGGFTTLAALAFHDLFSAGASHYGVSDLEALAKETHKFESRYLDNLIGPYPQAIDVYKARSPIHHVDGLTSPMIFFQGLEDVIVPPNQAEMMVEALRKKGIPVAYLAFEGEQHGFRKAETIHAVRRAELAFYGRVFGFEPADGFSDLVIENL
ncbi:MAG: S9 family peptidase [Alphaproteobacteria bacterium]